jgi:hypothetical protein
MTMGDGLASWAHARHPGRVEAKEKIERAPLSETTHGKAVPFPYADKSAYKNDFTNSEINQAIESAPKKAVPIAGLHAIQHSVKAEKVKEYIDHPNAIPEGQRHPTHRGVIDTPIIINYKGKRYIHDGHHRTVGEMLLGKKDIMARYVDLDTVKKV